MFHFVQHGKNRVAFAIMFCFFSVSLSAQMNRAAQAGDIINNIYQNNSHAITGAALQQVMLNQNNSYVNLLSDTDLLDVRLFSPYATYTPGMGVLYGDTLWMNILMAHGTWQNTDWLRVAGGGCVCSDYVKYADTVGGSGIGVIVTTHDVSVAVAPLIPWADTNSLIATKSSTWAVGGNHFGNSKTAGIFGTKDSSWINFLIDNKNAGFITVNAFGNQGCGYGTFNHLKVMSDSTFISAATGTGNTAYGARTLTKINGLENHLATNEHGLNCTAVGFNALNTLHWGWDETGIGKNTLPLDTNGVANTAVGCDAMAMFLGAKSQNANGGRFNTAIGKDNSYGGTNDTSAYNTSVGGYGLYSLTTGQFNCTLGYQSGYNTTTGNNNIFIGTNSGYNNTTASTNVCIGTSSLYWNQTGGNDVAIGFNAGGGNAASGSSILELCVVGYQAFGQTTEGSNTGLGYQTFFNSTTPYYNTGVGLQSGLHNTTGGWNTYSGTFCGYTNTTGSSNAGLGLSALYNNVGDKNTAIGDSAGYNATGVNSDVINGYKATVGTVTGSNEIVLGATAKGHGTNTATLGNGSITSTYLNGVVKDSINNVSGTIPVTVANADSTSRTQAVSSLIAYTVGSSNATFRIGGYINISSISSDIIQVKVSYTDENNTSQTLVIPNAKLDTVLSATGNYPLLTSDIHCKASTSITIKTTLTVATGSIIYDVGGNIEKIY